MECRISGFVSRKYVILLLFDPEPGLHGFQENPMDCRRISSGFQTDFKRFAPPVAQCSARPPASEGRLPWQAPQPRRRPWPPPVNKSACLLERQLVHRYLWQQVGGYDGWRLRHQAHFGRDCSSKAVPVKLELLTSSSHVAVCVGCGLEYEKMGPSVVFA